MNIFYNNKFLGVWGIPRYGGLWGELSSPPYIGIIIPELILLRFPKVGLVAG